MADKGARETDKKRHVFRRFLTVLVFLIAVRKIDANADKLFGIGNWNIKLDAGKCIIGCKRHACRAEFLQYASFNYMMQCWPFCAMNTREIDNAIAFDEAIG